MGSPTGLSLDYRPPTMKKSALDLQMVEDGFLSKEEELKEKMSRLEEEKRKIDAFKRELPLCMELVDDEIENVKQQMINHENRKGDEDKINWLSSAQLWSVNQARSDLARQIIENEPVINVNHSRERFTVNRSKGSVSAFQGSLQLEEEIVSAGLALSMESKPNSSSPVQSGVLSPLQRKARRCWSPELHRRFVNALRQLGGAQAAAPKQIRELMKVDGLTNDEVKSHLQKYRLHTRKPNLSAQIPAVSDSSSAPLVLFGGIWAPRDFSEKAKPAQSVSPQGPLQLAQMTRRCIRVAEEGDDGSEKSESHSWKGNHQYHHHHQTSTSVDLSE